ncbi:MAG: hypothetical protein GC129_03540 [Proteobacteria bacterium]|nr:hypothetical protein [Pseudomonadota bacterium]
MKVKDEPPRRRKAGMTRLACEIPSRLHGRLVREARRREVGLNEVVQETLEKGLPPEDEA